MTITDSTDSTQEFPDFSATPWHAMIGIRSPEGIADAGRLDIRAVFTPLAALHTEGETPQFNRTIPAVHFTDWLHRNRDRLVGMWETEYALYMNLLRATTREKTARDIGLIDPQGVRLGSTAREQ